MRHQMHLENKYRDMIKTGTKKIEVRLFDKKRAAINIGDEIELLPKATPYDPHDRIIVRVVGILRYANFRDLFQDYPIEMLAEAGYSEETLLDDLERLYTPGLQNTYGVVGFRIEPIKDSSTLER